MCQKNQSESLIRIFFVVLWFIVFSLWKMLSFLVLTKFSSISSSDSKSVVFSNTITSKEPTLQQCCHSVAVRLPTSRQCGNNVTTMIQHLLNSAPRVCKRNVPYIVLGILVLWPWFYNYVLFLSIYIFCNLALEFYWLKDIT